MVSAYESQVDAVPQAQMYLVVQNVLAVNNGKHKFKKFV